MVLLYVVLKELLNYSIFYELLSYYYFILYKITFLNLIFFKDSIFLNNMLYLILIN